MSELPNLVLTGFMGTGKSTVGHIAMKQLGMPFIDTDNLVVARAGMPVVRIFHTLGEREFRRIEREVCAEAAKLHGHVIATGGGTLVEPASLEAMMQNGVVICLWTPVDDLRERLTADPTRPLAGDWETLLEQRRLIYEAMPHHIHTAGKTVEQVAEGAIAIWRKHSA